MLGAIKKLFQRSTRSETAETPSPRPSFAPNYNPAHYNPANYSSPAHAPAPPPPGHVQAPPPPPMAQAMPAMEPVMDPMAQAMEQPAHAQPPVAPSAEPGNDIQLSIASLVTKLPPELLGKPGVQIPPDLMIAIPRDHVLSQLPRGAVRLPFGSIRRAVPPGIFINSSSQDNRLVDLPLSELLAQLHPEMFSRNPAQKRVEVPPEIGDLFGANGEQLTNLRILKKDEMLKPAAPAQPAPQQHAVPAPSAHAFERPSPPLPTSPIPGPAVNPRMVVPAPSVPGTPAPAAPPPPANPIAPGRPDLAALIEQMRANAGVKKPAPTPPSPARPVAPSNYHLPTPPPPAAPPIAAPAPVPRPAAQAPAPIPAPVPMPMPPTMPAPALMPPVMAAPAQRAADPDKILLPLTAVSDGWPDSLRMGLEQVNLLQLNLEIPVAVLEPALRKGRISFTWKEICNFIPRCPTTATVLCPADHRLDLPLHIVAPLFLQQRPKREVSKNPFADIPDVFSRKNADPGPENITVPEAPAAPPPAADPTPTAPAAPVAPAAPQPRNLAELFGEPQKRSWTPNEIVHKTCGLPNVKGAIMALQDGLLVAGCMPPNWRPDMVSAFIPQMFGRMNQYTRELQMGDLQNVSFSVEDGTLLIFKAGMIYFAALGQANALPLPQLRLIAAELARHTQ